MRGFLDCDVLEMDDITAQSIGDRVEQFLCDEFGLDRDGNEYYDATYGPHDWPVQIKGTAWVISNGRWDAHGRFRLYESDHAKLLENHGYYAFLVYERHSMGIIPLFATIRSARQVDRIIEDGWYDNAGDLERKAEGGDYRLTWPAIFPNTGAEL